MLTIKTCKIYKHKWERDKKSQIQEICFEIRAHLLYIPAFNIMKDFHYNQSWKITQYRNTYNELPHELLDSQVPHLFPQEQYTRTRKLTEAATSTMRSLKNSTQRERASSSRPQPLQLL